MKRWHLAKSKPQKAKWLLESLSSLNMEVFYPQSSKVRHGKRRHEPLFPHYIFCRFDPAAADWNAIRWAPGLDYLFGADGHPLQVPDDIVQSLKVRADATYARLKKAAERNSPADLPVGIEAQDSLGEIFSTNVNAKRRCKILLNSIGNPSPLETITIEPMSAFSNL